MKLLFMWSVGVPLSVSLLFAVLTVDATKMGLQVATPAIQGSMVPTTSNPHIETISPPLASRSNTPG